MNGTIRGRLTLVENLDHKDRACPECAASIVWHLLRDQQHTPSAAMNTLIFALAICVAGSRSAPEEVEAILAALPAVIREDLRSIDERNLEVLRDAATAGSA